jgi:carboxylesterase
LQIPVLTIHGRQDHTAPPDGSELIMEKVASNDKELIWLERSYHVITMDYERQEVFERTLEFIQKRSTIGV